MINKGNVRNLENAKKATGKRTALFALAALALSASLLLGGCSGSKKSKDINVNVDDLAKTLSEQTVTSDTLTQIPAERIASLYYIEEGVIEEGSAYMNSGATSCEVAVVKLTSADKCDEVKKKFEDHASSQAELYASYNEAEVPKLKNAVIESAGPYVVFCVCDDSEKAASILKENSFS